MARKIYLSITIGRNIGETPMSQAQWDNFIDTTRTVIKNHLTIDGWIFDGDGQGKWGNMLEDSHAFIVQSHHDDDAFEKFRFKLARLAYLYDQEAIGCAVVPLPIGESPTLVMAE